jgi:hypothetical protein
MKGTEGLVLAVDSRLTLTYRELPATTYRQLRATAQGRSRGLRE